jgi:hypothetical protein
VLAVEEAEGLGSRALALGAEHEASAVAEVLCREEVLPPRGTKAAPPPLPPPVEDVREALDCSEAEALAVEE